MEASPALQDWFGPVFLEAYLRHKRSEIDYVAGLAPEELCAKYAEVY
jgi:glutamine synthetase